MEPDAPSDPAPVLPEPLIDPDVPTDPEPVPGLLVSPAALGPLASSFLSGPPGSPLEPEGTVELVPVLVPFPAAPLVVPPVPLPDALLAPEPVAAVPVDAAYAGATPSAVANAATNAIFFQTMVSPRASPRVCVGARLQGEACTAPRERGTRKGAHSAAGDRRRAAGGGRSRRTA